MPKSGDLGVLSLQEAMDNLGILAGLDPDSSAQLGVIPEKHQFITDSGQEGLRSTEWLSGEGVDVLLTVLDVNFQAVYRHLLEIWKKKNGKKFTHKERRAVQAMMDLCGEAAQKLAQYLSFRLGKDHAGMDLAKRPSYLELQKFYQKIFSAQFSEEENWAQDWQESEQAQELDFENSGLKDFESVRRDLEYELFLIRDEEDQSYFDASLLRNIKLACHFEMTQGGGSFEEDPLLRVRSMLDRDAQISAQQIVEECLEVLDAFYHLFRKLRKNVFAQHISMSISALYLAANSHNLVQRSSAKTCLQYFQDFHSFLRSALWSVEYQKYIEMMPNEKKDEVSPLLLRVTHALCYAFFFRKGGIKQEVIALLHLCMRKGVEKDKKLALKGTSLWNQLFIEDEKLRAFLSQFPNGPLFKILDLITEESRVFDPYLQQNYPQELFSLYTNKYSVDVVRLACPVIQSSIQKIQIAPEFYGFLHFLKEESSQKRHLLINFQDRNSWIESARSRGMENLQRRAEFKGTFFVMTLSKNSDFYHQNTSYVHLDHAKEFMRQIEEEIGREEGDFFFPSVFNRTKVIEFARLALPVIHELFFEGKETLDRRERQDFVEIFYQMMILKMVEILQPTTMSFTCKDAIDTGAAAHGLFFGFVQLLTQADMVDSADFLRWLLYAPALLIRERAIDVQRFSRVISVLETISLKADLQLDRVKKAFSPLFEPQMIQTIGIRSINLSRSS